MLISIETHITCDFPGGGGSGPLYPPPPSGSAHVKGLDGGLGWVVYAHSIKIRSLFTHSIIVCLFFLIKLNP